MKKHVLFLFFTVTLIISQGLQANKSLPVVQVKKSIVAGEISSHVKKYLTHEPFRLEIEAAILATNKLRIVNNNKQVRQAVLDEQDFSKSDLSKGNAASSGQLLASNYLVFPTIKTFSFYTKSEAIPNIANKFKRSSHGRLVVDVQFIDTSTNQIMDNYSVSKSFSTNPVIVNKPSTYTSRDLVQKKLLQRAALDISSQLIDAIYPMRVLSVKGNKIWINRGQGSGLSVKDRLNIYKPGEPLIDPDTGKVLETAEEYVGVAEVQRVNNKTSILKVVKLESGVLVEKLDVLRKYQ